MTQGISGPSEQLQSTMRKYLNREVREWFSDVDFSDLDITTPRGALVQSCRHDDADSFLMTIGRTMLFDSLVRQRFQSVVSGGFSDEVGETRYKVNVHRQIRPQMKLCFIEDLSDVQEGYAPIAGRISFRLMNHNPSSLTPVVAKTYANKVKNLFSSGNGFVWKKGKEMCSYTDWESGYQFQLLCRTKAEGRRIVEQVLDIQSDSPNWNFFEHKENEEPATAFPTIPPKEFVYGENRRLPRRRPIADVRFSYAALLINGLPQPLILLDRTGVLGAALVRP